MKCLIFKLTTSRLLTPPSCWLESVECFMLHMLQPSTPKAFTSVCEDVIRTHDCRVLPSHSIFLHLQKTHVWTGASFSSKEEAEVLCVCLCRFNPGRPCDSGLHSSKRQAWLVPLLVRCCFFFACLLDAESSSVIESESKGTSALYRALRS